MNLADAAIVYLDQGHEYILVILTKDMSETKRFLDSLPY